MLAVIPFLSHVRCTFSLLCVSPHFEVGVKEKSVCCCVACGDSSRTFFVSTTVGFCPPTQPPQHHKTLARHLSSGLWNLENCIRIACSCFCELCALTVLEQ